MPRAFLITHRRYNSTENGEQRESSPEHKVSLPEAPTSPNAVQPLFYNHRYMDDDCTIENTSSNECPDDLYNLTKLAEVSLAAAAGQLYHHRHLSTTTLSNPPSANNPTTIVNQDDENIVELNTTSYAHKLFDRDRDRTSRNGQQQNVVDEQKTTNGSGGKLSPGVASPGELENPHECPDCGKRYSTSSNLARHRQTHRSLADKKARRCPHCDKVYVSMPAYSMHVRTHVQGCRCPYCGKCFSRPWLLQGHIRTHTGEKPFRCSVCQKAFADKSNLRAHVQTHSDTKPHVCARCGKAFALKSYLYKHEESSCMRGQRQTHQQIDTQNSQIHSSQTITQSNPLHLSPTSSNHHLTLPNHQQQLPHLLQSNPQQQQHLIKSIVPLSAPTPVIVRPADRAFRSTVISPNPERALICTLERPTTVSPAMTLMAGRFCLNLPRTGNLNLIDEQPMDFSASSTRDGCDTADRSNEYGTGIPIIV